MKISMELTLDGMLRALKWQAYEMAEEIERDYPAFARRVGAEQDARHSRAGEDGDDGRRT